VLTPKELALTAAADAKDLAAPGNGQSGAPGAHGSPTAGLPALGGGEDEGGGESR